MKKIVLSVTALMLLATASQAANMKYNEEDNNVIQEEPESSSAVSKGVNKNESSVFFGYGYGLVIGANYHMNLSDITGKVGPGYVGVELGFNYDFGDTYWSILDLNGLATYKFVLDSKMSVKAKLGLVYSSWSYNYNNTYIGSFGSGIGLGYGASFDYDLGGSGIVGLSLYDSTNTSFKFGVSYTYAF